MQFFNNFKENQQLYRMFNFFFNKKKRTFLNRIEVFLLVLSFNLNSSFTALENDIFQS